MNLRARPSLCGMMGPTAGVRTATYIQWTELGRMNVKKLVALAAVALVLFFLITQPTQSAALVTTILTGLKDAALAVITFVKSLFG